MGGARVGAPRHAATTSIYLLHVHHPRPRASLPAHSTSPLLPSTTAPPPLHCRRRRAAAGVTHSRYRC
ncbi:hypothetical protein ZWY2020_053616 [Hordeum vulgare]|nr:hypothetical protein ZWY2020_053616 [Hordeum vulgare]